MRYSVRLVTLATAGLFGAALTQSAAARTGDVENFGGRSLDRELRTAVLLVGPELGRMEGLRLRSEDGALIVRDVRVTFANGRERDVFERRRARINPGETLNLDLPGQRGRVIERIEIDARATRDGSRRAVLFVGGKTVQGADGENEVLETVEYNRRSTAVRIPVGRAEGRFRDISLRALDSSVRVRQVVVTFGNGRDRTFRFRQNLSAGATSERISFDQPRRIRNVVVSIRRSDRGRIARMQLIGNDAPQRPTRPIDTRPIVLGDRLADTRDDSVMIPVDRANVVDAIRIRAEGARLNIRSLVIERRRGSSQRIRFRETLRDGETSAPIDISGERGRVESVRVNYEPRSRRGQVRVSVLNATRDRAPVTDDRIGPAPRLSRNGRPVGMIKVGSDFVRMRRGAGTIEIGRDAGRFQNIALVVKDRGVRLREVRVVYGNGRSDTFEVRERIRRDGASPVLRLNGRRFVDRVELETARTDRGPERAEIEVYAAYSRSWLDEIDQARDNRGWLLLGTKRAEMFSRDTDAFPVGRDLGRFDKIRVRARRNDVRLYGMTIHYGNGNTEDVDLFGRLKRGQVSQEIDLRGRDRFIDRITLRYRSRFSLRGEGKIEVWGRRTRGGRRGDRAERSRDDDRRSVGDIFRNEVERAIRGLNR